MTAFGGKADIQHPNLYRAKLIIHDMRMMQLAKFTAIAGFQSGPIKFDKICKACAAFYQNWCSARSRRDHLLMIFERITVGWVYRAECSVSKTGNKISTFSRLKTNSNVSTGCYAFRQRSCSIPTGDGRASYETHRINHSEAYSSAEGCTNQAESFFSRLRRAEIGTHHHIAGPYLGAYAAEMDWREDRRRVSNGEQFAAIVTAAAKHPVSRKWKGYWQRRAA